MDEQKRKELFQNKMIETYAKKKTNCTWMTKEEYDAVIGEVMFLKSNPCSKPRDYWISKKYDVLQIADTKQLITKPVSIIKPIIQCI